VYIGVYMLFVLSLISDFTLFCSFLQQSICCSALFLDILEFLCILVVFAVFFFGGCFLVTLNWQVFFKGATMLSEAFAALYFLLLCLILVCFFDNPVLVYKARSWQLGIEIGTLSIWMHNIV